MGNVPVRPSESESERLAAEVGEACVKAAHLICDAEVLLLATGAGFSADSGLAVYKDIAKVEAYAKRDLEYHDLCIPDWLDKEPDLFWGFWGMCANDYRDTRPHAGYDLVKKWRDQLFHTTERARATVDESPPTSRVREAYEVQDRAGAFFVFTSNVDAHSFDVFDAHEIRECHGSTELYQCAEPCAAR